MFGSTLTALMDRAAPSSSRLSTPCTDGKSYQRAEVCYAYLSDMVWRKDRGDSDLKQPSFTRTAFLSSNWFTRDLTLQELIAPSNEIFSNGPWQDLGTKLSLKNFISEVTGI